MGELKEKIEKHRYNWGLFAYVLAGIGVIFMVYQVHLSTEETQGYKDAVLAQVELLSRAIEPIVAVDKQMKIRRVSLSAARMLGANPEDIVGTMLSDYMIGPMNPGELEIFEEFKATGKLPGPIEWILETKHQAKENIHVRIISEEQIFDAPGLFKMHLVTLEDD